MESEFDLLFHFLSLLSDLLQAIVLLEFVAGIAEVADFAFPPVHRAEVEVVFSVQLRRQYLTAL